MKSITQRKAFIFARISIIFAILCLESLLLLGSRLDADASSGEMTIFFAGDAIFNRPWSNFNEPKFLQLINEIRSADVAVCNLETLIHTYKGFPQTESSGTYVSSDPSIAKELVWAGFDMVGEANNHTYNYGPMGVLETIKFVEEAGLGIAGSGDLQRARSPIYHYSEKGTVALLSATSSFADFQKASKSRPDFHGRPGCNPLAVPTVVTVTRSTAEKLQKLAEQEGLSEISLREDQFRFLGQNYRIGDQNSIAQVADEKDVKGNLEAIQKAKAAGADVVVFAMHAHSQGKWLEDFAHKAIDTGVDVFLTSGPHYIKEIEIYKGKPIFYSLGNFVFQSETVKKLPAEYIEAGGYDDQTTSAAEFQKKTRDSWNKNRIYWEGLVATVHFKDGKVENIRLLPTTMGAGPPNTEGVSLPFGVRGRPLLANAELGKYLIKKVAELSKPLGTEINYIESENIGIVKIK